MALTKSTVSVFNTNTMTAGGADAYSAEIDVTAAYSGSVVCLKLTNGATGPTVAGEIWVEIGVDENDTGGADIWYEWGGHFSNGTGNSGSQSWCVDLPFGARLFRVGRGSNTDEDVVCEAWLQKVTALA